MKENTRRFLEATELTQALSFSLKMLGGPEVLKTHCEELTTLIAEVYERHFTQEELAAITDFLASGAGRKWTQKSTLMAQECMHVGAVWGAKVMAEQAASPTRNTEEGEEN
jgi:hypothetical protein